VTLELKAEGVFRPPPASECLVFHRDYLTELLPVNDPQRDMVGSYIVLADSAENAPNVAREIDQLFTNSPYPTRNRIGEGIRPLLPGVPGQHQTVPGGHLRGGDVHDPAGLGQCRRHGVRERTREMAILRTLGFRPGEILQLVLGERVVISLLGGVLGLGIGWALSKGAQANAAMFGSRISSGRRP